MGQMKSTSRANSGRSGRFALFVLFARFANDRMTQNGFGMKALGASRRFSAWLRWSRWGAQLHQKGGHGSSSLRQGQNRTTMLPGPVHPFDQGTCQHQLVVRTGQYLCPAFGLLWGAQTGLIPEQYLLVQPIAMLVRVAQPIGRTDLGQGRGLLALPDKPTDSGVAWAFAGPRTDDLDHAHLNRASGAQMQLGPAPPFHALACGIRPLPAGIRFTMSPLIAALKTRSIFATGTTLTRLARWGGAVQDAIAFDAQETTGCYLAHACQKGRARVPAVPQDHRTQTALHQQLDHGPQLLGPDLRRQPSRSHPLGVQHKGSLPRFFGQQDDAADHPTRTHRMVTLRHIGNRNQRAIGRRFGFPAVEVAGISSQKDVVPRAGKRSKLDKDLTQLLGLDPAVLKGFIQARPSPLEHRRERQLGKAVGRRFTAQRVHRVEERIAGLLETSVDRVTKFIQRVKVHLENAPPCFSFGGTLPHQAILCKRGLPELTLV